MFRNLLINESGSFNQWLKSNNKISMLHSITYVGLLMLAEECLKRRRKRLFLPSDWQQALVEITRGLPQILLVWS